MSLTPEQKLSAARLAAVRRAPYFSTALMSLVPRKMPGLKTMGVTEHLIMYWDPAAVAEWSVQETAAVLIHEIGHVLRDHAKRCRAMGADHKKFNLAGDAEINDDIKAMGLTLPGKPVFPESLGCKDGLTAEEYYRAMPPEPSCPNAPDAGSGWCGGAAGNPIPNESDEKDPGARSANEIAAVVRATAAAIQDAASKGRGNVPAGLERWADAAMKPAKVRWQDKLARIGRNAVAYRPGAVDRRFSRPARKQAAIGYGPGRPILPALVAPVPRIMIAIDTSGSMGQDELNRAVTECSAIFKATGAVIDFVSCDADVHATAKVRSWQDIARNLKGGGGTDFYPVFEHAAKMRARPEILVFITDGDGPAPAAPPPGMHVIWLLVGPYRRTPANYGDVIEVDDDAAE